MSESGKSAPVATAAEEARRLEELRGYGILDTLPEQAYDDITLLASQICDCPIALVSLIDDDRQWFKSRVGLDATETPRDLAFCAHAILEPDQLLMVPDATRDKRFASNPLVTADPMIRFYAGAPLRTSAGHALGTLCVIDRVARELEPDQIRALEALSRQVMAQLELRKSLGRLERHVAQRRQYERRLEKYQQELEEANARLAEESVTDPLTGLRNRRALDARLASEGERARRYSLPLALVLLDVDFFKAYNDSFGHPTGDRVLEQLAGILMAMRRTGDFVARHGGEEFALLVTNTGLEGARFAAERLRRAVEEAEWPHRPVTVSLGVAVLEPGMSDLQLMAAADDALYRAKQEGRNRVCAAGVDASPATPRRR